MWIWFNENSSFFKIASLQLYEKINVIWKDMVVLINLTNSIFFRDASINFLFTVIISEFSRKLVTRSPPFFLSNARYLVGLISGATPLFYPRDIFQKPETFTEKLSEYLTKIQIVTQKNTWTPVIGLSIQFLQFVDFYSLLLKSSEKVSICAKKWSFILKIKEKTWISHEI